MTVPYTFANTPGGASIPLAYLDANFAAVSGGGATASVAMQQLTITTYNVLPSISNTYLPNGLFLLIVNGQVFVPVGTPPAFSVSGTNLTWNSTVFGINPGDSVFAVYSY